MAWMGPIFKGDVVVTRRVTVAEIKSMRDWITALGTAC
jgi:hypothetical protein